MYNVDVLRYDEMRPGCYDVDERVRDMNAGGQLAGLNFPNWTGFSGQVLNQGPDRDTNLVMIRAYNDWHVDEWCGAHPGRFIPCGILPLFDVEEAAKELRRLADKGCHAVTYSENPEALGLPSIHTDYWDPLFAAAVDVGTVLCCHLGSSSRSAMLSPDAPASSRMTMSSTMSMWTLGEMMWADFWNRFPDLKISITEGDVGWIPYFLWRAEHVHDRHSGWTKHEFPNGGGPSDVFKRHMVCCFISDPIGVKLLDELNEDMVCWESDYPHSDSNWPNAPGGPGERGAGRPHRRADRQDHPRQRHAAVPVRPVRDPAEGAVHRRRRCGPSRPTSTPSPTWAGRPTSATSSSGTASPADGRPPPRSDGPTRTREGPSVRRGPRRVPVVRCRRGRLARRGARRSSPCPGRHRCTSTRGRWCRRCPRGR